MVVRKVYKILISDFEDTLLDEEDAIPLSTMLSLDRIRNQKITYTVISKKSFKTVLDYNKDFPFMDYIIVLDGAYVYDVNKDKPLFKRNIAISIIKKIYKVFEDYNLCFYTLDWCNYTKDVVKGDNVRKIGDFKVFSAFHKDNIFKVEIRCNKRIDQSRALKELEELNLDITYYARNDEEKGYYVEIVMAECSRLDAISRICKARRCGLKDVVFVGSDDDNISVFKKVGLSFAVDNSSSKLKKSSNKTTVSNYDKAVETVIKGCFK